MKKIIILDQPKSLTLTGQGGRGTLAVCVLKIYYLDCCAQHCCGVVSSQKLLQPYQTENLFEELEKAHWNVQTLHRMCAEKKQHPDAYIVGISNSNMWPSLHPSATILF